MQNELHSRILAVKKVYERVQAKLGGGYEVKYPRLLCPDRVKIECVFDLNHMDVSRLNSDGDVDTHREVTYGDDERLYDSLLELLEKDVQPIQEQIPSTLGQPMIPIRLEGTATLCNAKVQFPNDTLNLMVVCNSDNHTYQVTDIVDGKFKVNFDLHATQDDAKIIDTLKFHFFSGKVPILVTGGFIPFEKVFKPSCTSRIDCNFTNNSVVLSLKQVGSEGIKAYESLQGQFKRSALRDSMKAMGMFQTIASSVGQVIPDKFEVDPACGAVLFLKVATAHCMEGQMTTYMHYQSDMQSTPKASKLFYDTGLSMMAIADTMHFMAKTPKQVMEMDGPDFTNFVSQVCQFCMRSAHVNPYMADMNVGETLDNLGNATTVDSEAFKRPFYEPFTRGRLGALFIDDCEGHAKFIEGVFQAYVHMYQDHKAKPQLQTLFPPGLFKFSQQDMQDVYSIASKIGKEGVEGRIKCLFTLISAQAASLGAEGSMGGHCCCSFQWHGPGERREWIAEGTNFIQNDAHVKILKIKTPLGDKLIPMTDIANHITKELLGTPDGTNKRMGMHLLQSTKVDLPFYVTAFCQGDTLLATRNAQPNEGFGMKYGVCCNALSDYKSKIEMPVTGKMLDQLVKPGASKWLAKHCNARALEMHTPTVGRARITEAISTWAQTTLYTGDPLLDGRDFTNCVVSEAFLDPQKRNLALEEARVGAQIYNKANSKLGYMRVWMGLDSVFKSCSVFTDDTTELQKTVSAALCHLMQVDQPTQ